MKHLCYTAIVLVMSACVGFFAANSFANSSPVEPPGTVKKLSNERDATFWASPELRAAVYHSANRSSRKLGNLVFDTEDGLTQIYLVLSRYTDHTGGQWVKVRFPKKGSNTRTGWVQRSAFGPIHKNTYQLSVHKKTLRATLRHNNKIVWSAQVGVGKPSTPTPNGHFIIRERLPPSGGIYGPLSFGTSAYANLSDWPGGAVVGLHGTDQPNLIPGRISHGCIRMRNSDVLRLGKLLRVGTPLYIY